MSHELYDIKEGALEKTDYWYYDEHYHEGCSPDRKSDHTAGQNEQKLSNSYFKLTRCSRNRVRHLEKT